MSPTNTARSQKSAVEGAVVDRSMNTPKFHTASPARKYANVRLIRLWKSR